MSKPLHKQHTNEYKVRLIDEDSENLQRLSDLTGIAPAIIARNAIKSALFQAQLKGALASSDNKNILPYNFADKRG